MAPRNARLLCPWDSPGKNTGVGCHALLQGIFSTQGSNLHLFWLLHCRWILYRWATRGSTRLSLRKHQFFVSVYGDHEEPVLGLKVITTEIWEGKGATKVVLGAGRTPEAWPLNSKLGKWATGCGDSEVICNSYAARASQRYLEDSFSWDDDNESLCLKEERGQVTAQEVGRVVRSLDSSVPYHNALNFSR